MPRSVIMAVTYAEGVTSKAGLATETSVGAMSVPRTVVTSSALRCSMGIASPEASERSIVEQGATT